MLQVWPKKIFIGADTEIKNNNDDKEPLDQTLHYNYRNEAYQKYYHLDVNDKFKLMVYYNIDIITKSNKVFGFSMEFTNWYLQLSRNQNRHAN